jgi:glutamate/tyrosine decarboxylase-like PLP-dependent enzyme
MQKDASLDTLKGREAPLDISPDLFREMGHRLIDDVADFLDSLPNRPVGPGKSPAEIRKILGDATLPEHGTPPDQLLKDAVDLMFENSLFNGHPRFWGYVTSSAAPISALADLLASSVNSNVGGWSISPIASEIEAQTIRWIAELIGFPTDCGGLLVSGGNVSNFVGFMAARRKQLGGDVRTKGMGEFGSAKPRVYCSAGTHTWIEKAADQYGIGTDSIRWISTNDQHQMDLVALREQIDQDIDNGDTPFLVVGTGGTVAVGAIDALPEIAALCREYDLWFHVDGAYGGLAACLPDSPTNLKGLSEADSVAIDPHKWLYSSLEAGCALVRDSRHLIDAYSYHPTYYEFEGEHTVYERMISDDIRLSEHLYQLVDAHPNLEAFTHNLSIATFRYVPPDLTMGSAEVESYLSTLNEQLLTELQNGGETFVSNAVFDEIYVLRACIVNFRTSLDDVEALPEIITRVGGEVDTAIRSEHLAGPT